MSLSRPRAVLFDWDNTLVDTWPVIHAALSRTFTEMGQEPWPLATTMAKVRRSMRDSFPEIFGPDWEMAGALYQQHYRSHHLDELKPLPGAEELLNELARRGVPMGIVSNKRGPNLRTEVSHLGWDHMMGSVVGADDAERDKPFPEPLLMALSAMRLEPGADVWFVGDSEVDLDCAARVGCAAVLYGPHASAHPEYTATHYMGFPYVNHVVEHDSLIALLG